MDGQIQACCLVSNRNGLPAFEAGFHHATFIAHSTLFTVLVADVHFNPGDVLAEPVQCIIYRGSNLIGKELTTFDIMVCIDLNLHDFHLYLCLIFIDSSLKVTHKLSQAVQFAQSSSPESGTTRHQPQTTRTECPISHAV